MLQQQPMHHHHSINKSFVFLRQQQDVSEIEEVEANSIEVVNNDETIYTALLTPEDHYQELNPNPAITADPIPIPETLPEKTEQMTSLSLPSLASSSSTRNYLTMTGTSLKQILTAQQ